MTLTGSWQTVPITGLYSGRDGQPLSGTVAFIAPNAVYVDGVLVVPVYTIVALVGGALATALPVTSDAGTQAYTVIETITGSQRPPYGIQVAFGASGVNLTTGGAIGTPPISYSDPVTVSLIAGPTGPAGPMTGVSTVDGQSGAVSLSSSYVAGPIPIASARPVGAAIVLWIGGTAGTPPAAAASGDLWIHS